MVVVAKLRSASSRSSSSYAGSSGPFHLIQRSFSSRKVARQYPVLAGLHRAMDGALLGVLVAVIMMSSLSLHWRNLWTTSYRQLEDTRDLIQKLKYTTAMLEQHLLKTSSLPASMVRTNTKEHLLFIDNPNKNSELNTSSMKPIPLHKKYGSSPVSHGY